MEAPIQSCLAAFMSFVNGFQINGIVYLLFLGPLNAQVINTSHLTTNKAWKLQWICDVQSFQHQLTVVQAHLITWITMRGDRLWAHTARHPADSYGA